MAKVPPVQGYNAAATDNSLCGYWVVALEETFPHAADTYDTDWAWYTTEDTNTDVATYPVVYSQAGELTENLITHHDNNAAGLHRSSEVA